MYSVIAGGACEYWARSLVAGAAGRAQRRSSILPSPLLAQSRRPSRQMGTGRAAEDTAPR